jgi:phosphatidylserine/phosphatidylglycerophosphate/cardiolipin synthase-like enzyme
MPERILHTSPVTGITLEEILKTVLVSELLAPSPHLWLLSPWITDVVALNNRDGNFDHLLADPEARPYRLSELLAEVIGSGARLTVIMRRDHHNQPFQSSLERRCDLSRLSLIEYHGAHEKTFCGTDWVVTGSMNFTLRGMEYNDEGVTYKIDSAAAATTRLELAHRWSRPS